MTQSVSSSELWGFFWASLSHFNNLLFNFILLENFKFSGVLHFGQSSSSTVDSLRKSFSFLIPSNPKDRVDHFHALTPMSYDALGINAMQVSLHVISCYMQHVNHTLHVKCHG